MISDNFWKILFLLMVFTGLGFWYKNYAETKAFKNTAAELANLIAFTEEALPRNDEEAHQRFIQAVNLVQQAGETGINSGLLIDAAFEYNEISRDGSEATLVRNSLFDSQENGRKLGIFNPDSTWDLQDGQPVMITEGPFKGERIAVAFRVPPSFGEGARLFLGNMLLVPESVASINHDVELTESVYNTSIRLANANIISDEAAKTIKESYYMQRERNKY